MKKKSEHALTYKGDGETPESVWQTFFQDNEKFYQEVSSVVDCGAGSGAFSLSCAMRTDARRIYAYDGYFLNFSNLVENVRNNGVYSIVPDDHHISDKTGREVMSVHNGIVNALDKGDRILCESRSLDELTLPEFDLLRIAVPGQAAEILIGGREKIEKYEPSIIVESVSRQENRRLQRMLEGYGYSAEYSVETERITGIQSVFSFHVKH